MSFKKISTIAATALAVAAGLLTVPAPAAEAAAQVYNPCYRLSAGQTKYSSYNANRVTFVTAVDRNTNSATITSCVKSGTGYKQEWQDWGYIGLNGFAAPGLTWENSYRTPSGSYTVTEALGRANPGTALRYYTVNRNSKWGGERGPRYNQYFEGAGGPSDENLWTFMNQGYYEQAAVINYNRQPDMKVTQGASFAIFFHAGRVPSAGCVSTSLATTTRLVRSYRPGDRIIMGAVDDVFTPYSSNRLGAISSRYAALGGQRSFLGNPASNETQTNGGAYQHFTGGSIYWSAKTGARTVRGAIRQTWFSAGAERNYLGFPLADEKSGLKNGGVVQNFQGGTIYWSPTTGARITKGAIRTKYASLGYERGYLGYPISSEVSLVNGGVLQNFQGGTVYWTAATGARVVRGGIMTAYKGTGYERGRLGYPTSDEFAFSGGVRQNFQNGVIIYKGGVGTFVVSGAIGTTYKANAGLGLALSNEIKSVNGGVYQSFQNGIIYWSAGTGAHVVTGGIRSAYQSAGAERGTLGYPTSSEIASVNGGVYQTFQNGAIYWSSSTGARIVSADFDARFKTLGGLNVLGYPTANKVGGLKDGGTYQSFQKGYLVYSPATGIRISSGVIRTAYAENGYENGALGYPTSDIYTNASGQQAQDYQGGVITVGADGKATVAYPATSTPAPAPAPSETATPTPTPTATEPAPAPTATSQEG
jgi:uncharacterized protein with LGFP repeats